MGKKVGVRYGSIGNGGEVNHTCKERKGNGDKRERERERKKEIKKVVGVAMDVEI